MPDGGLALLAFGTDEELKALGKMTMLFASLDEVIADQAESLRATFSQLSNLHNGRPVAELRFDDKQELTKSLVHKVAEMYRLDSRLLIDALGEAKKASKDRNRIIHGWLTWDYQNGRAVFKDKKGKHLSAELDEILRINAAIRQALENVVVRFGEFFRALLNHEVIARRAYELWEARGRPMGSPEIDWFRAESELSGEALSESEGWTRGTHNP